MNITSCETIYCETRNAILFVVQELFKVDFRLTEVVLMIHLYQWTVGRALHTFFYVYYFFMSYIIYLIIYI